MTIDKKDTYSEACDAALHFSTSVLNTRTSTIVQGFAIITGALYLCERQSYTLSLIVVIFGVFFTLVLRTLQRNYLEFWFQTAKYAAHLEDGEGPWSACIQNRSERLGDNKLRVLLESGSELLIVGALLAVLTYDIFRML